MKMQKATYTLPEVVLHDLNTFIEQRHKSRFVAEAIRVALEDEKRKLEEAYEAAASDKNRLRELEEWASTDGEGWE